MSEKMVKLIRRCGILVLVLSAIAVWNVSIKSAGAESAVEKYGLKKADVSKLNIDVYKRYRIKFTAGNGYLTTGENALDKVSNINNDENQLWNFFDNKDGSYSLFSRRNTKYILFDAKASNGIKITLDFELGKGYEDWYIYTDSQDRLYLVSKVSPDNILCSDSVTGNMYVGGVTNLSEGAFSLEQYKDTHDLKVTVTDNKIYFDWKYNNEYESIGINQDGNGGTVVFTYLHSMQFEYEDKEKGRICYSAPIGWFGNDDDPYNIVILNFAKKENGEYTCCYFENSNLVFSDVYMLELPKKQTPVSPNPTAASDTASTVIQATAPTAKPCTSSGSATGGYKSSSTGSSGSSYVSTSGNGKKSMYLTSLKLKKKSKRISGKLSVKNASVRIKVGKKDYRWAIVNGKSFYLDWGKKIKSGTKVTVEATLYNYKKLRKTCRIY